MNKTRQTPLCHGGLIGVFTSSFRGCTSPMVSFHDVGNHLLVQNSRSHRITVYRNIEFIAENVISDQDGVVYGILLNRVSDEVKCLVIDTCPPNGHGSASSESKGIRTIRSAASRTIDATSQLMSF